MQVPLVFHATRVMLNHRKGKVLVSLVSLVNPKVQLVNLFVHNVNLVCTQMQVEHLHVNNVLWEQVNHRMHKHHVKIVHQVLQLELQD
jgi:hypothetical protein